MADGGMDTRAGERDVLRVCTFKGLQNLPLYVASRQGYFASRDLDVQVSYTTGSAAQLEGLGRGAYELIQTAPDNVVNADANPAAFNLDPATALAERPPDPGGSGRPPDAPTFALLLGGSVGPLSLMAHQSVASVAALRGMVLGVDNPGSGFALVLRDMLARHGLALDRDYTFTISGGTSARLDALRSGTVAATLLYPPFDALAEAAGFRRLVTSTQLYPAYASLATAATQPWIEAHGEIGTRYIGAILQALRWLYDPANATDAQALIRDEPALGGLDAGTAARAYADFVAPATGFGQDAALDMAGLRQVIALRAAYANPAGVHRTPLRSVDDHPAPLRAPEAYCDLRWYERARRL
ncbi:MAG TPA: ABC transporter substrate-binding protein [Ktedonobacterales bacterium]